MDDSHLRPCLLPHLRRLLRLHLRRQKKSEVQERRLDQIRDCDRRWHHSWYGSVWHRSFNTRREAILLLPRTLIKNQRRPAKRPSFSLENKKSRANRDCFINGASGGNRTRVFTLAR